MTATTIPTTRFTELGVFVIDETAVARAMTRTAAELRADLLSRRPLDRRPRYRTRVNALDKRSLAVILTNLED